MGRERRDQRLGTAMASLLVLTSGCALFDRTAAATWELARDQRPGPGTSEVEVLVTRVGCNSGVTGEAKEPAVDFQESRVVVTFVVTPGEPSAADCQGNRPVPYRVALDEPLGSRQLVDGQCLPGGEAADTLDCESGGGVRYTPRD